MAEKYIPRLQKGYKEEMIPALMKELDIKNVMQVPKIEKIIVNMGVGEATSNPKLIETALKEQDNSLFQELRENLKQDLN